MGIAQENTVRVGGIVLGGIRIITRDGSPVSLVIDLVITCIQVEWMSSIYVTTVIKVNFNASAESIDSSESLPIDGIPSIGVIYGHRGIRQKAQLLNMLSETVQVIVIRKGSDKLNKLVLVDQDRADSVKEHIACVLAAHRKTERRVIRPCELEIAIDVRGTLLVCQGTRHNMLIEVVPRGVRVINVTGVNHDVQAIFRKVLDRQVQGLDIRSIGIASLTRQLQGRRDPTTCTLHIGRLITRTGGLGIDSLGVIDISDQIRSRVSRGRETELVIRGASGGAWRGRRTCAIDGREKAGTGQEIHQANHGDRMCGRILLERGFPCPVLIIVWRNNPRQS